MFKNKKFNYLITMSDTNYIGSIVKILETPKQKFLINKISVNRISSSITSSSK
jgi:hypothetical protein